MGYLKCKMITVLTDSSLDCQLAIIYDLAQKYDMKGQK